MKRWRLYLPIFLIAIAIAGWAWTQPVIQQLYSGNEVWNCGQGPSGPGIGFCSVNIRNSDGYIAVSAGNATVQLSQGVGSVLLTFQPFSGATFLLPQVPIDGQIVNFCNVTQATFAGQSAGVGAPSGGSFPTSSGTVSTFGGLTSANCNAWQAQVVTAPSTINWYRVR